MAAIPTLAFPDAEEATNFDEKMDVASSPFRQADDIDIDFDPVRDPSVAGSVLDEMVDDTAMPTDAGLEFMQDQFDETFADDYMYDDTKQDAPEARDDDHNMGQLQETHDDEDEDILYEDEDELRTASAQPIEPEKFNDNDVVQESHEGANANISHEGLDRLSERQQYDPATTNEPESFDFDENTYPSEELAESLEQATHPEDQILDTLKGNNSEGAEQDYLEPELPEKDIEIAEDPEHYEEGVSGQQSLKTEEQIQENETIREPQNSKHPEYEVVKDHPEEPTKSTDPDNPSSLVHPVTIVYLEDEMSLFPPLLADASSVYFLSDSSLAAGPLDHLLAACREILDGTLDHHDELVLDVPALGLHICEDSKYAAQITMGQILEVYLRLCRNHAGLEAKPLTCHLSSRVSLATQYAYLASAGSEGKTYAEIAADHLDSPESEGANTEVVNGIGEPHDDSNQLKSDTRGGVEEQVDDQENGHDERNERYPQILDTAQETGEEIIAEFSTGLETQKAADVVASSELKPSDSLIGAKSSEEFDFIEEPYEQDREPEAGNDQSQAIDFADGDLDIIPDVDNLPEREAEDGTNSFHTVEGDFARDDLQNSGLETSGADITDLYDYDEQVEDPVEADESTLEPHADYEAYDGEELFDHDVKVETNPRTGIVDTGADGQISTFEGLTKPHSSQDKVLSLGQDEGAGKDSREPIVTGDGVVAGNLSPPLTPPQGKQAKRKVDDDEFLFLDLDTPDPKRRRPS